MGEVSFAAVLRWVTRIDDFTRLLTDTTERERVLHLQRSEECSLTFLNWRSSRNDHYAVVAARAVISDHGCYLFAKQLRLVSPPPLRQFSPTKQLFACCIFLSFFLASIIHDSN